MLCAPDSFRESDIGSICYCLGVNKFIRMNWYFFDRFLFLFSIIEQTKVPFERAPTSTFLRTTLLQTKLMINFNSSRMFFFLDIISNQNILLRNFCWNSRKIDHYECSSLTVLDGSEIKANYLRKLRSEHMEWTWAIINGLASSIRYVLIINS